MTPPRHALIAAALLALGGCAARSYTYSPPADAPSARLRVVLEKGAQTRVAVLSDTACGTKEPAGRVVVLGGPFSHEGHARKHVRLGIPGGDEIDLQGMHEFAIPAERPFVLIFADNRPSGTCSATLAFRPIAGQDYEAVFGGESFTCGAALNRLQKTADGVERVKPQESLVVPRQCGYPATF